MLKKKLLMVVLVLILLLMNSYSVLAAETDLEFYAWEKDTVSLSWVFSPTVFCENNYLGKVLKEGVDEYIVYNLSSSGVYRVGVSLGLPTGEIEVFGMNVSAVDRNSKSIPGAEYSEIEGDYRPAFEIWNREIYSYWIEVEGNEMVFYPERVKTSYDISREVLLNSYGIAYRLDIPEWFTPTSRTSLVVRVKKQNWKIADSYYFTGTHYQKNEGEPAYLNEYTLKSRAEASFSGWGGDFGIKMLLGERKDKLNFVVGMNYGWVAGVTEQRGSFMEHDEGYSGNYPWEFQYEKEMPIKKGSQNIVSNGFFVAVRYKVLSQVVISLGYAYQNFENLPCTPLFHYRGVEGSFWENDRNTSFEYSGPYIKLVYEF
ncbi:MAG: hypothetical protein DRH33_02410 [Candidatus Nealsonbacteria bacterium]|nr:MAG: hypothetical protein DRH33_02410 [Candidatus Nealsonbacteria bacterium]